MRAEQHVQVYLREQAYYNLDETEHVIIEAKEAVLAVRSDLEG
jgi:hypothetical protein